MPGLKLLLLQHTIFFREIIRANNPEEVSSLVAVWSFFDGDFSDGVWCRLLIF